MGKLIKARPRKDGFGILGRSMEIKDPQVRAAILQNAALKLAEYREANFGLQQENERLKTALESTLKRLAEATGMPWPPVPLDAQAEENAMPLDTLADIEAAQAFVDSPETANKYDAAGIAVIRSQIQAARERLA